MGVETEGVEVVEERDEGNDGEVEEGGGVDKGGGGDLMGCEPSPGRVVESDVLHIITVVRPDVKHGPLRTLTAKLLRSTDGESPLSPTSGLSL